MGSLKPRALMACKQTGLDTPADSSHQVSLHSSTQGHRGTSQGPDPHI